MDRETLIALILDTVKGWENAYDWVGIPSDGSIEIDGHVYADDLADAILAKWVINAD